MQNPESNPMTLLRWIAENQPRAASGDLSLLLSSIQLACKSISNSCNKAGIFNLYGTTGQLNESQDRVKKLDVFSNQMMINSLKFTNKTAIMASEENESVIHVDEQRRGKYAVVFDPLDGSSNIDANISVGTIFGIYKVEEEGEPSEKSLLQKGNKMVVAGYCMYGSATILVLTFGNGVYGFTLDNTMGEFVLTHPKITIPDPSRQIYSVNEGNSSNWDEAVSKFVEQCHNPQKGEGAWSHRYVGSMVSDVHRTINYGGIFMYPADKKNKSGKLRLVYEGNPMAFLVEQAGGKATTGKVRILDLQPTKIHQRVPVVLGTSWMVERLEKLYKAAQI